MTAERQNYSLESIRADDWFQRVAESAPNFDQLCEAIGERYVAFSLVAGVRITALAIDQVIAAKMRSFISLILTLCSRDCALSLYLDTLFPPGWFVIFNLIGARLRKDLWLVAGKCSLPILVLLVLFF